MKSRFLPYGLRATPASTPPNDQNGNLGKRFYPGNNSAIGQFLKLLDRLASFQVPHGSFRHFYIVSILSSLFWGSQILSQSSLLRTLCQVTKLEDGSNESMSMNQIGLAWSFLVLQGARRLLESYLITPSSASRMWFVHWVLGMVFYLAIGVAIWIEGAGTLLNSTSVWDGLTFSVPSMRTLLCIPTFILASGVQHDCHTYLASLPKYTLPVHPLFQSVVCPHYTAECVIYASMAFMAAPAGAWINRTLFCAFIFVLVNLGVTASSTKEWYAEKFGRDKVEGRWKILPLLF